MKSFTSEYLLSSELPFIIFAYLLVPILILMSIKKIYFKTEKDNAQVYGKDDTSALRGIAATVVMIHHYALRVKPSGKMFYFWFVGYLAVAVFFFISGYSSYVQMNLKKEKYFKGYFFKRFLRLLVPYFASNTICAIMYRVPFREYIYGLFTCRMMRGLVSEWEVIWFLIAILYFTVMYYICYRLINKKYSLMAFFVGSCIYFILMRYILEKGAHWYNTSFAFFAGIAYATYKDRITNLIKKYIKILLPVAFIANIFIFFIITKGYDNIYTYILCQTTVIMISVMASVLCDFRKGLFTYIGGMSWELFLIHPWIASLYYNDSVKSGFSIIMMMLISLIVSAIINKIDNISVSKLLSLRK